MRHFSTPLCALGVILTALLLGGCGGPATVSHKDRVPLTKSQIVGQWEAMPPENNYVISSPQLIQFNADGSGILINSFILKNPASWGGPIWVYYFPISWQQTAHDAIRITAGKPEALAGYYRFGWFAEISGAPVYSTVHGLVVDGFDVNNTYFSKALVPVSNPQERVLERVRALTDEARRRHIIPSPEQIQAQQARNQAQNQALVGALGGFSQGMNMGNALAGGGGRAFTQTATQQMAAAATQEVMVAALTDSPEEAQAARQAFQTGYNIGSGNTQAAVQSFAQGNAGATGQTAAAGDASGTSAQIAAAISSGRNFSSNVTVPSTQQYGYTDGYAYNIQTVLPNSAYRNPKGQKTAGEFCIMYGLPLEQARSLLATGFALSGDRSVYGTGNPQQIVSWERVSVRNGGTVRMGVQWQSGTLPVAPQFANSYINSKP